MGEYAEIGTYLRGRFRPLDGPDDPAHAQTGAVSGERARQEFMAASSLPEAVNTFLLRLDAKLDALLDALYSSSREKDFPHTMEVHSISASRLLFSTDLPLAPGDWLEVVVSFPQADASAASGIGQVTAREGGASGAPLFAFSFTRIREEEREKIIRHVFTEERRLLREARLE